LSRLRRRGSRLFCWLSCVTWRLLRGGGRGYRRCRRRFRRSRAFSQRPLLKQSRNRKQKRDQKEHYRCGYGDLRQHRLSAARTKRRRVDAAAEHRRSVRLPRLQQHEHYQHQTSKYIKDGKNNPKHLLAPSLLMSTASGSERWLWSLHVDHPRSLPLAVLTLIVYR